MNKKLLNKDLHIVLLAAGLSQRLGFPKQLIFKNECTLLEEKIRLALKFSQNVWVVVPDMDTLWAKQIVTICRLFPLKIVTNSQPDIGMAHSIQLATVSLYEQNLSQTDRVLFLTIDQIALNREQLAQLTQPVSDKTLIASRYGNPKVTGIPVNMPFGFLTAFVSQLAGDKGFGKILAQLQADSAYRILTLELPELAWDIDTPEQFCLLKLPFNLSS